MLDETLVVAVGEFGRSPKRGLSTSGNDNSADGRDHWPYCFTSVVAGAGIKRGNVHGRSDATGSAPLEDVEEIGDIAIAALGPTTERQVAGPAGVDLGDGPLRPAGRRYRAVILQLAPGDLSVVDPAGDRSIDRVVIALPLEDDEATIRSLGLIELLAGGLALLLLIVVVDRLLRRLLRPLDTMAETATAVAQGETDRRVTLEDPAAEIERLATALNTAFDRRQEAEGRLSRFVADASHELRTPLTKIRGWAALSVAGGVKPEDTAEVMATIDAEASRMSAMIDWTYSSSSLVGLVSSKPE